MGIDRPLPDLQISGRRWMDPSRMSLHRMLKISPRLSPVLSATITISRRGLSAASISACASGPLRKRSRGGASRSGRTRPEVPLRHGFLPHVEPRLDRPGDDAAEDRPAAIHGAIRRALGKTGTHELPDRAGGDLVQGHPAEVRLQRADDAVEGSGISALRGVLREEPLGDKVEARRRRGSLQDRELSVADLGQFLV